MATSVPTSTASAGVDAIATMMAQLQQELPKFEADAVMAADVARVFIPGAGAVAVLAPEALVAAQATLTLLTHALALMGAASVAPDAPLSVNVGDDDVIQPTPGTGANTRGR
jgi:hypothetical protein